MTNTDVIAHIVLRINSKIFNRGKQSETIKLFVPSNLMGS